MPYEPQTSSAPWTSPGPKTPKTAETWCEVVGDDGSIYFALLPSFRGEVRIWKDGDEVDPEEIEPEVAAAIVGAVRDARSAQMS